MTDGLRKVVLVNVAWFTGLALVMSLLIGGAVLRLGSHQAQVAWLQREIETKQGTLSHYSTLKADPDLLALEEAMVLDWEEMTGSEALRVADASIMPDVIRANTNLTTIMIGERVADWIASDPSWRPAS